MPAENILIVEDDGIICANLEDMLVAAGYGVLSAVPSGEAALSLLCARKPDLVLIDIKLAGKLDGIEVAHYIRKVADVPVIYLTAYADDILIKRARETLPYSYLVKPVKERELIATIEIALHKYSLEQQLKAAGRALRQSEELYKKIVDHIFDLVALTDLKGKIRFVGASYRVLGYDPDDLIDKNILDFVHPADLPHVLGAFKNFLANPEIEQALKIEYRCRCADGSYLYLETVGNFLLDKNGERKEILFSTRDITERKKAEETLRQHTKRCTVELERFQAQLDKEMERAVQIYTGTLPVSLPTVCGISFGAHFQPAHKLGGDYYDLIQVGRKLVFYLSDVVGHGLDGAMFSLFIRHNVNNYVSLMSPTRISPANLLRYLVQQFKKENYPEELYFCIFINVLDLDSLELTYCGAGFHEMPLVQWENGERSELTARGIFVTSYLPEGMYSFQDDSIRLTPGTTILFTTDGLPEQLVEGVYYRERLAEVFYANAHLPPEQIVHAINEDFRRFNGGSLQGKDDITFLILQVETKQVEKGPAC